MTGVPWKAADAEGTINSDLVRQCDVDTTDQLCTH
jgi:hypothetical protein